VYNLLVELGGKATVQQLRDLAEKKYPKRTLHLYITNRLLKLQKWGMVRRDTLEVTKELSTRFGSHSKKRGVDLWVVVDPEEHRVLRINTSGPVPTRRSKDTRRSRA
jgi:hypothetical protein